MDYILQSLEEQHLKTDLPELHIGDTIKVHNRIIEGKNERVQVFQGTLIARQGSGPAESIVVRKTGAHGVGVERIFRLHSPRVEKIEVVRSGKARRAKLYYLRQRTGKSARLKEVRH